MLKVEEITPQMRDWRRIFQKSRSLSMAMWIGLGGAALALANLIFAGVLDQEDFGRLTLFEAILFVGVGTSPLGFDKLAVRGELPHRWSSLTTSAAASFGFAVLFSVCITALYGLSLTATAMVAVGCLGGAIALICAGFEQAAVRLHRAQALMQVPFIVFAGMSVLFLLLGVTSWFQAAASLSGGYAVSALVGLVVAINRGSFQASVPQFRVPLSGRKKWQRACTFLAIAVSGFALLHIERLIIPHVLSLSELAVFGVAWTIVGAPYKLLQGGIGFSLLPELQVASSRKEKKELIWRELKLAGILGVGGALLLLIVTPFLVNFLYAGKYDVDFVLVGALVVAGLIRVGSGVGYAVVTAVGDGGQLAIYNLMAWLALGIAVAGAVLMSPLGLAGVVTGAALGWLGRILAVYLLVRHKL